MPDISMCDGENKDEGTECPVKWSCHRFTAIPSEPQQDYYKSMPMLKNGMCSQFWSKVAPERKVKDKTKTSRGGGGV